MKHMSTKSKKILAAFLSVLLVLSSIPIVAFTALAANRIDFKVIDESGKAISGATVVINSYNVSDGAPELVMTGNSATTDNSGNANFDELDSYIEDNVTATVTLSLTASAEGYNAKTVAFTAGAESSSCEITLTENKVKVTATVAGRDDGETVKLYAGGVEIASGTEVSKGTKVTAVPQKNGTKEGQYTLFSVSPETNQVGNSGEYTFTIDAETNNIVFTYVPLTYTVSVTVENGEFNSTNKKNNGIIIYKTEDNTEVTFVANEGYHFKEATFSDNLASVKAGSEKKDESNSEYIKEITYVVDNTVVDGGSYSIKADFDANINSVTVNKHDGGAVKLTNEGVDLTSVPTGTVLNFKAEPEQGKYLTNVIVNGESILNQQIVENSSFSVKITKDTVIDATFGEVDYETLKNSKVNEVFSIRYKNNNRHYDSGTDTYFIRSDNSITILPKGKIGDIYISKMDIYSSDVSDWVSEVNDYSKNDDFSPLQVISYKYLLFYKEYGIPGTIRVRVDSQAPEITDIEYYNDWTNENVTVTFKVTDNAQKYKGTDYASGVKTVTVSGGYLEKAITVKPDADGNCTFSAPKPNNAVTNEKVEYKIVALDNVNNKSEEKTVTIKNDTEAPALKNITFSEKNIGTVARIINTITFGKWAERKLVVQVEATDTGAGFDGENSKATLKFSSPINGEDEYPAEIDKDGKATIEISAGEGEVFKGYVEYKLSDRLGNESEFNIVTRSNSNIGEELSGIILIEENKPTASFNIDAFKKTEGVQKYPIAEDAPDDGAIFNKAPIVDFSFNDADSGLYSVTVTVNGKELTYKAPEQDSTGNPTDPASEYKNQEGIVDTHKDCTVTVDLAKFKANENDGSYVVTAKCTDNAGNESKEISATYFVDKTAPVISGFKFALAKDAQGETNIEAEPIAGEENLYDAVSIDSTDYSFFFQRNVVVTVKAEDKESDNEAASGVQSITYRVEGVLFNQETGESAEYIVEPTVLEVNADNEITFTIPAGFKGKVFAYATDNVLNSGLDEAVGGESWKSPDGSVLEDKDMHKKASSIEIIAPGTSKTEKITYVYNYSGSAQPDVVQSKASGDVPLYAGPVTFTVKTHDSHSGIKKIVYKLIYGGTETTLKTTEVPHNGEGFTTEENSNLVPDITENIEVDSTYNYNDMVLLVELTDRVGNVSYDYYVFGIDTTAPVILLEYSNNSVQNGKYFRADRIATVTIIERNFKFEDVVWTIKNIEGGRVPAVSDETIEKGKAANGDDTKHIFTINYNYDGAFNFGVAYTDLAGNTNGGVQSKSVAITDFVIDKTAPTISVSYNNNSAQNGKYFNAPRTATITIVEHNFDVNFVTATIKASIQGGSVAAPSVSWSNNGDTHTGTVHYSSDGDYTFDITMLDLAGNAQGGVNYGGSVAAKDFTVDTKIAKPIITGVENGKAYKDDAHPGVDISEINFASGSATLVKRYLGKTETVYENKALQNGRTDLGEIAKVKENDGIYTLSVNYTDKAGNKSSESITFTVNRFGSVYDLSDDLKTAIDEQYNDSVGDSIYVVEYNPTRLKEGSTKVEITLDGAPIEAKYTVTPVANDQVAVGESGWYQYEYDIDTSNFSKDGVYSITVSSMDAVEHHNITMDYDADQADAAQTEAAPVEKTNSTGEISFVKDSTPPSFVSILGLEKSSVYAPEQEVSYQVYDAIGLKLIEIYIGDSNKPIQVQNFEDPSNYSGTFKIAAGNEQKVQIKITDLANHTVSTGDASFELKDSVKDVITVTSNPIIYWYYTRPLFWGTIGGAAVLAGIIIFLVGRKRRKKEDSAEG